MEGWWNLDRQRRLHNTDFWTLLSAWLPSSSSACVPSPLGQIWTVSFATMETEVLTFWWVYLPLNLVFLPGCQPFALFPYTDTKMIDSDFDQDIWSPFALIYLDPFHSTAPIVSSVVLNAGRNQHLARERVCPVRLHYTVWCIFNLPTWPSRLSHSYTYFLICTFYNSPPHHQLTYLVSPCWTDVLYYWARVSSLINAHSTWVPILNNALQQWLNLEVWTNMWSRWICSERNRWCGCVHPWCDTPSRCIELEPSWRSYSSTGVISLCSFSLDCRFVCWSEGMSVNTEGHLYSKKMSENDI